MTNQAETMRKCSSVSTKNVSLLPEEILCVILSWLEEKYLLRCKSVCKVWHALIVKNMQFIDMHAISNGRRFYNLRKYKSIRRLIFTGSAEHLNGELPKKKFRYLYHSCTGLLVEGFTISKVFTPDKYRIRNPTTKRILDLPHPHKGVAFMRVFFNSSTNSYNVVSLYDDEEYKVKLELLDLGGQSNDPCPNKDLSWRNLNIPEYDKANIKWQEDNTMTRYISEEGILFILKMPLVGSINPIIVCVDPVQQICTTVNAPESLSFKFDEVSFQLWRGKPTILSFVSEEKLNVWVLEDYKKQKWSDDIVIPLPFLNQYPNLKETFPQIHEGDEEDFLVYSDTDKNNDFRYVYKLDSKVSSYGPTPPISVPATFVSVKGMRSQKKKSRRNTLN